MREYKLNFESFKDDIIAIYGTGNNSILAFEKMKENQVVCFVERKAVHKEHLGLPVLTIEDAYCKGVNCIIAAAELSVEKIIYDRIGDFCLEHNIKLYGIYAGNLFETFGTGLIECNDIERNNIDFIKKRMESHNVISFDLFDTLVMRKVVDPVDIFDLVENEARCQGIEVKDFKRLRMNAELGVYEHNHTFEGIYHEFQRLTHISDREKETLMDIEVKMEKACSVKRSDITELFMYAVKEGKRVFIVTDMYLPKRVLKELLHQNGIEGYEDIFISGYEGVTKANGLFCGLQRFVGKNSTILHIGDNYFVDGLSARAEGIEAVIIESAKQKALRNGCEDVIALLDNVNSKLVVGMFLAKMWNNGLCYKKTQIDFILDYTRLFVAPLISGFVIWLVNKMRNSDYEKILFCARDGFLIKKMYDYARKIYKEYSLPESVYFYSSRRACKQAVLDGGTGYKKYLEQIGLDKKGKYVFVDLMSSGTSYISLKETIFENLSGYFLSFLVTGKKEPCEISSYFEEYSNGDRSLYTDSNLILEFFMTSSEPSLREFGTNGEKIFCNEIRDIKQLKVVEEAQKCILDYFKEYLALYVMEAESVNRNLYRKIWLWRKRKVYCFKDDLYKQYVMDDSLNDIILGFSTQI